MSNADLPVPVQQRKAFRKVVTQWLRRGHLYAGLLMLPWVALYGVTAFLFNHPTAFADQAALTFNASALEASPMMTLPTPGDLAAQVVGELQKRAKAGEEYELAKPEKARFTREFAFATVKAEGQEVSVLLNINGTGGSIRTKGLAPPKIVEKAPFAIGGKAAPAGGGKGGGKGGARGEAQSARVDNPLILADPLHERIKASVPGLLERHGLPQGEVTVTSVPDLAFTMYLNDQPWHVTYNAQTGTLNGRTTEPEPEPLSARRFLQRLHLAHGYPSEMGARWIWGVIVDIMAALMLFWSVTGVIMWWQIKATRKLGAIVLVISTAFAVWLGIAMHDAFTTMGAR